MSRSLRLAPQGGNNDKFPHSLMQLLSRFVCYSWVDGEGERGEDVVAGLDGEEGRVVFNRFSSLWFLFYF